jgi:AraC-like DNA-binding protein
MDQVLKIIFYLGFVQGALLSVFLFSIRVNKISNRLLGLLTLFWGIVVGSFAFHFEGYHFIYPHSLKVSSIFLFSLFPLLYLQVKYLLSKYLKFSRKDLIHFLPLLIVVLLNIGFYFKSAEEKIYIFKNESTYYYILRIIQSEILSLQGVIYSILALKLLAKYQHKIRDYQSNIDKMIIKVQSTGIYLSLFAWIIGIVAQHLEMLDIDINFDLFIFVYLTLVIIIYIISYTAIKSPEIFKLDEKQIQLNIVSKTKESIETEEFPLDNLNEENQDKIDLVDKTNDKLLEYITKEKPYLNPELSLQELADQIGVKRYFLSIVINQKHNKNFFEFINEYRIEEFKSNMKNPKNKHFKIISIAYDSGFNSKTSFNRIFKQLNQMTPSQYMSRIDTN